MSEAEFDPGETVDLIYRQVIEYMSGRQHTALPQLIEFVSESDQPLETLAALADACLERLAVALVDGVGRPAALEYARGMLLHNQLSRIERGV